MDQEFKIPKRKVAEVYDTWKAEQRRTEGGAAERFFDIFSKRLTLNDKNAKVPKLPKNRSAWYPWRKADTSVVLTREACQVLFDLSGVRLIPEHRLDRVRNYTSVVTMTDQPSARSCGNGPDEENGEEKDEEYHEMYELSVPRIAFRRSEAMRVTRSWIGHLGTEGEKDIGSVVFALRQASIDVAADGATNPRITLLKPSDQAAAQAEGVTLSDDPARPGRWIVDSESEDGVLLGAVTLPDLAFVRSKPDGDIVVSVEAKNDAISPHFVGTGQDLTTVSEKSRARNHLIEKVLKLALCEDGTSLVLSRSIVEKR